MRFPNSTELSLHGSFYPDDVYPGENVFVLLKILDRKELGESRRLRVWRLSPLGVELLVPKDSDLTIHNGSQMTCTLYMGAGSSDIEGVVVEHQDDRDGNRLLALRILGDDPVDRRDAADRRSVRRWICHDMYLPTCVWKHPARFNEFVFSRVKDLSSSGARLVTSMRNKFLVRGVSFFANFNFVLVGQFQAKVRINNLAVVTEMGKEYLSVGVTFEEISALSKETIAQYLIQFGLDVSPLQLVRSGLNPVGVSSGVTYSYVRTESEYEGVLELRRAGYVAHKKMPTTTQAQDMGSALDARARIVIGRFNGKIVATAALVFHEYHDRMEIEEDVEWPKDFPRKENCVEVIRMCTHASFRGSDVLLSLFHFIGLTVAQSGREYIVFGATDGLIPTYSRLGMQPTELTYRHQKLMGMQHTVIVADVARVMAGRTMGPFYWNVVWRDVSRFLVDNGVLKLSTTDRIRVLIYEALRPLSLFLLRTKRNPRLAIRSVK